jgi:radical SAM superfamily enzyme YgiQ (UPF0313 family)
MGHDVTLIDLCFDHDVTPPVSKAIETSSPDVIGISMRNLDNVFGLAPRAFVPRLKRVVDACRAASAAPIVLGGAGFSIQPEEVLDYCDVDLGIVGEAEEAFPMLLDSIADKNGTARVPGLIMRNGGGWLKNERRFTQDLDTLPSPAVELFDQRYRSHGFDRPVGSGVETKRGCAFGCIYCVYPLLCGRAIRFRSPKRVAHEVKAIAEAAGPQGIEFVDSVFNYPQDHAVAVCDALIAERSKAEWSTSSLHPAHCSDELLGKMVDAGCRFIGLGVDSGSDKMLKVLDKGFDRHALRRSLLAVKRTGVPMGIYLLFGGPGEDIHTVEDTLSLMEDLDVPGVCVMYGIRVYRGTRLAEVLYGTRGRLVEQGWLEPRFCMGGLSDEVLTLIRKYLAAHPTWLAPGIIDPNQTPQHTAEVRP